MEFVLVITLIILCYAALVTYSLWWFFMSREAVLSLPAWAGSLISKIRLQPVKETGKSNKHDECSDLDKKLDRLNEKRKALLQELLKGYSSELCRELHIIDHHIEVTTARINGEYNCPEADLDNIQIIDR